MYVLKSYFYIITLLTAIRISVWSFPNWKLYFPSLPGEPPAGFIHPETTSKKHREIEILKNVVPYLPLSIPFHPQHPRHPLHPTNPSSIQNISAKSLVDVGILTGFHICAFEIQLFNRGLWFIAHILTYCSIWPAYECVAWNAS